MVEPTESEPREELERFAAALKQIRWEMGQVERGVWPRHDNPLVNAPHTLAALLADEWSHPYSRMQAAYPLPSERAKVWPPVGRIDEVYGDRLLLDAAK